MHYGFFGLSKPPFEPSIADTRFFQGGNRQEIVESLIFAIDRGRTIALVGENGLGKSSTIHHLRTRLKESIRTYDLSSDPQQFFQTLIQIKQDLEIIPNSRSSTLESGLTDIFQKDFLPSGLSKIVLIIEKAEHLPKGIWTSLIRAVHSAKVSSAPISVLFVGTSNMKVSFDCSPERSPIDYMFKLSPLKEKDSISYIKNRLESAGGKTESIFSIKAIEKIANLAKGYPQRINKLCNTAMKNAFHERKKTVLQSHITGDLKLANHEHSYHQISNLGMATLMDKKSYIATSTVALIFVGVAVYALTNKIIGDFEIVRLPNSIAQLDRDETERFEKDKLNDDKGDTALIKEPLQAEITIRQPTKNLLDNRLEATLELLKTTNDSQLSIQLLGGENPKILRQQIIEIATDINISEIFAFRTIAQGKPYISIIYGRFDTISAAQLAIDKLPKNLKANRPYLRTAKGIKEEIKMNTDYLKNFTEQN